MKEFSDPLYGFIKLYPHELEVVDSFPFQRLRYVKQLGVAYLVFPSAQHTRFEHALGVLHITDRLARTLGLKEEERVLLRLAGLLHDLGHPPFSHTTEVLLPGEKTHEDFTERVIRETELYGILKNVLGSEGIEKLVRIALGRPGDEREKVLSEILTGEFGSDRMDYLRRDAYFCGVSYGFFDYERLLNTTLLTEEGLVIDSSGLRSLENFLISRYFMYVQVYFHRVVRILSIHLVELVGKIFPGRNFLDIREFLRYNDASFIARVFEREDLQEDFKRIFGRKHFKTLLSTSDRSRYEKARDLLAGSIPLDLIRFDELYKRPYEGNIKVLDGKRVRKVEEVSPLVASLKPIEVYRIYVDREVWKEAESLLRNL
ncbi:MAG: HD domain-containing protein [Aquificae bacterium]|nr:HD domain-containing protein [Aquificota bacterium]